jgi:hypothetical protein
MRYVTYMTTTKNTTKTLTNAAWVEPNEPLRTLTLTRASGKGALRTGDRYTLQENGTYVGSLTLNGRHGGMNVWTLRIAGSDTSREYGGDLATVAWSLAG